MKKILKLSLCLLLALSLVIPINAHAKIKSTLNHSKLVITTGETTRLRVSNFKKGVKWNTSNKDIVTVSKNGKVTGVWFGKATVYAKVDNKKVLKCKVRVLASTTWFQDGYKDGYHYRVSDNEVSIMNISKRKARVGIYVDNVKYGTFYVKRKGKKYTFVNAGKYGISGTIKVSKKKCVLKLKNKGIYEFNGWWDAA